MLDTDRIWDEWRSAREDEPDLAPEAFAARYGSDAAELLEYLEEVLALESAVPAAPLVDLTRHADETFSGFELGRELGRGGSGIVYLAREASSGRRVALKILNPLLATTAERRAALLREAEVAGRLDHPGIVSVASSGVEHGYAWMAMDYVEGRRLDELVDEELSPADRGTLALDVAAQLADILAYAHREGVIHRDLKPANILVDPEGAVHVLDFGLAKTETSAFAVSRTGEPIGTPLYMAPEQLRGERDIGPWTDLYALGLILLELGTGRRIEPGPDFLRTMSRIARGHRRLPRRLLRELPSAVRPVVSRCTEPTVENRYPDVDSFSRDLEALTRGEAPPMGSLSSTSRGLRYALRHRTRVAASALLVTALGYAGWWLWWNAPVDVHLDTYDDGKQVKLDGVLQGLTTPMRLRLRPGTYEYETWFQEDPTVYSGTILVPRRESVSLFQFLEPFKGLDSEGHPPSKLHGPEDLSNGTYGWLQVVTDLERIDLTVDGDTFEPDLGCASIALPFGEHTFLVEAPGRRPIERTIQITENRLHFFAFDPDSLDSEWHTTVIYGPMDELVRSGTVDAHNLRIHPDPGVRIAGSDNTFVQRFYFAPLRPNESAHLTIRIELPVVPSDLTAEVFGGVASSGDSWSTIEMGASERTLRLVGEARQGREFAFDPDALDSVASSLGSDRILHIRFAVGDTPVGDRHAYGRFLRTEGVPARLEDGTILWKPAMRIRTRP